VEERNEHIGILCVSIEEEEEEEAEMEDDTDGTKWAEAIGIET
jgi:hypothetical protein